MNRRMASGQIIPQDFLILVILSQNFYKNKKWRGVKKVKKPGYIIGKSVFGLREM